MAKRFEDIKRTKPTATKRGGVSSRLSGGMTREDVSEKKSEKSNISNVFEIKPGFFIPRSGIPPAPITTAEPLKKEISVPPAPFSGRSSEEYFSALSSHGNHQSNTKREGNISVSPRLVLPSTAKHNTARAQKNNTKENNGESRDRLNIPLSSPPVIGRRHFPSASFFSLLIIVAVLVGAFFTMRYFSTAEVTLTPRQEAISVSATFEALRASNSVSGSMLSFETMSVPDEISDEIPADEERTVHERAEGTIVVYNAYSAAPQRLIKNTRFATGDGKIFRAKDSIVVPGTTTENGKTIPGSVEAVVVADEPGEAHNIGLVDFTIPGFKGDPRYDKFYARSKTEMSGGFSGTKKFPSETAIAESRATLRSALTEKLMKSAQAQKPPEYILFSGATSITLADDPSIVVDGSRATITERGIISGIIIKRDDLTKRILTKSIETFEGEDVDIPDLENLTFLFVGDAPFTSDAISFSLSGSVHAIWNVDTEGLVRAIAGKPKKEFNVILGSFSNIRRAEAAVSPFGLFDFPKDPARITTQIVVE